MRTNWLLEGKHPAWSLLHEKCSATSTTKTLVKRGSMGSMYFMERQFCWVCLSSYLKWLCNKLLKLTLYLHPQKGFYQVGEEKRALEKWEERVEWLSQVTEDCEWLGSLELGVSVTLHTLLAGLPSLCPLSLLPFPFSLGGYGDGDTENSPVEAGPSLSFYGRCW